MKTLEQICIELLNYAIKFEAHQKVINDVTALELASVVIPYISVCPICKSENFTNKECWLCNVGNLYFINKKIEN